MSNKSFLFSCIWTWVCCQVSNIIELAHHLKTASWQSLHCIVSGSTEECEMSHWKCSDQTEMIRDAVKNKLQPWWIPIYENAVTQLRKKKTENERESDRESTILVGDTFNSCQQGNYMGLKLIRGINTSITNDPQERLSFAQSGSYCCLTGRQKVEQESLL